MLTLEWRSVAPRLTLQWIGDAGTAFATQPSSPPQIAAIIGPPGPPGPPGPRGGTPPAASLVVDLSVSAGAPLAIDRATGRLARADAAIYPRAIVVGLAAEDTAAGFVADAIGAGPFVLADWSAITGSAALLPGRLYYLAEGGGLTADRPQAGGTAVAIVGEAVSPTTLALRPLAPILL